MATVQLPPAQGSATASVRQYVGDRSGHTSLGALLRVLARVRPAAIRREVSLVVRGSSGRAAAMMSPLITHGVVADMSAEARANAGIGLPDRFASLASGAIAESGIQPSLGLAELRLAMSARSLAFARAGAALDNDRIVELPAAIGLANANVTSLIGDPLYPPVRNLRLISGPVNDSFHREVTWTIAWDAPSGRVPDRYDIIYTSSRDQSALNVISDTRLTVRFNGPYVTAFRDGLLWPVLVMARYGDVNSAVRRLDLTWTRDGAVQPSSRPQLVESIDVSGDSTSGTIDVSWSYIASARGTSARALGITIMLFAGGSMSHVEAWTRIADYSAVQSQRTFRFAGLPRRAYHIEVTAGDEAGASPTLTATVDISPTIHFPATATRGHAPIHASILARNINVLLPPGGSRAIADTGASAPDLRYPPIANLRIERGGVNDATQWDIRWDPPPNLRGPRISYTVIQPGMAATDIVEYDVWRPYATILRGNQPDSRWPLWVSTRYGDVRSPLRKLDLINGSPAQAEDPFRSFTAVGTTGSIRVSWSAAEGLAYGITLVLSRSPSDPSGTGEGEVVAIWRGYGPGLTADHTFGDLASGVYIVEGTIGRGRLHHAYRSETVAVTVPVAPGPNVTAALLGSRSTARANLRSVVEYTPIISARARAAATVTHSVGTNVTAAIAANANARADVTVTVPVTGVSIWSSSVNLGASSGVLYRDTSGLRFLRQAANHHTLMTRSTLTAQQGVTVASSANRRVLFPAPFASVAWYIFDFDYAPSPFFRFTRAATGAQYVPFATSFAVTQLLQHLRIVYQTADGSSKLVHKFPRRTLNGLPGATNDVLYYWSGGTLEDLSTINTFVAAHDASSETAVRFAIVDSRQVDLDNLTT